MDQTASELPSDLPAESRVALVTGSTAGLGLATASSLAAAGWHVILHGPDAASTGRAAATLRRSTPTASLDTVEADLSSQRETRRLASVVEDRYGAVDALVNNAAAVFDRWSTNGDGIELTFAVNYLAVYLLTRLLLPAVERSRAGRIVNVASEAHRGAAIDFDDLQGRSD